MSWRTVWHLELEGVVNSTRFAAMYTELLSMKSLN